MMSMIKGSSSSQQKAREPLLYSRRDNMLLGKTNLEVGREEETFRELSIAEEDEEIEGKEEDKEEYELLEFAAAASIKKKRMQRDRLVMTLRMREAPGRLENASDDLGSPKTPCKDSDDRPRGGVTECIDIKAGSNNSNSSSNSRSRRRVQRQVCHSSEACREEAWERKRDQFVKEEVKNMDENKATWRAVGRCISDCGDHERRTSSTTTWPRTNNARRSRARSLTDEDLDELRGCIDLGFGFRLSSNEEDPELCTTLPALELCYAIARQFNDSPSPTRTVTAPAAAADDGDGDVINSNSSPPLGSPGSSWRIASPGDHPQQVKTRLRHWAQAVACTVRQCC